MLPTIKGFVPSSMLDWDGEIVSVLFLPGCNLRCPYCHAARLVLRHEAMDGVDPEAIRTHLAANEGWIDGIVISGGEPTLHEGLAELCEWCRSLGMKVKLDTNGTRPDVVRELLDRRLVDFIAMDVKAPFDQRYAAATRADCDVDAVRSTAEMIISAGIDHGFRTTVCPAVSSRQDILDIAQALHGAGRYILQPFRPLDCLDATFESVSPMPLPELREIAAAAREFVSSCKVRGD